MQMNPGQFGVQLKGFFLELLTVMTPEDIPEHGPDSFSFAAHNRDYLAEGEGFSMLVLESVDARVDQQRFAASGLKTYRPFDFARKAKLPSGDEVTVGFSMAFATDPLAPQNAFFTCQQHAPQHFWKPEYQQHANTAHTIMEVCMVSPDPSAHAQFLQTFTGAAAVAEADGLTLDTPRGRIAVLRPNRFEKIYRAQAPDLTHGARLAGYCIGVTVLSIIDESFRGLDELRPAFYGLVLMVTMLFLPDGLVSLPAKIMQGVNWLRSREAGGLTKRE